MCRAFHRVMLIGDRDKYIRIERERILRLRILIQH